MAVFPNYTPTPPEKTMGRSVALCQRERVAALIGEVGGPAFQGGDGLGALHAQKAPSAAAQESRVRAAGRNRQIGPPAVFKFTL